MILMSEFSSNGCSQRDDSFDVLKGIAILLVIVGHCETFRFRPFIYSFHMPLFFFIAGFFLKYRPFSQEISLSFKRLIVPYAFTSVCICVSALLYEIVNYSFSDGSYFQKSVIVYLLGSRGRLSEYLGGNVDVLWFLLALFWARCITAFLIQKIHSEIICCLLFFVFGILGTFLYKNVLVPYCLAQGLCAVGFVYAGTLMKKYEILEKETSKNIIPFLLILWLYSWNRGWVNMAGCRFDSGYLFSLGGSLGIFIVLYTLVKNLYSKKSLIWKFIHFCGRYSLVIYSVHAIEKFACDWKSIFSFFHIPMDYSSAFQIVARVLIAYLGTRLLLKNKFIREKIYQI
jgi:fucose 4-O-acetylase-like acetyltransferase